MPEMHFRIQWPDGSEEMCYSPSLVIKDYFSPGQVYDLEDFLTRSRTAFGIANERMMSKYGFPCSRAISQLQRLESAATQHEVAENPKVQVLQFQE